MSTKQTLEKGVKYAGRQQERHQSDVVDVRCYVFLVDFEKTSNIFTSVSVLDFDVCFGISIFSM